MTMKPWSRREDRAVDADVEFDVPVDELISEPAPTITTMRADCCIAQAAYLVVLPATPSREHASELLLCGHHFRASREGLRRANATAFDGLTHRLCAIAE